MHQGTPPTKEAFRAIIDSSSPMAHAEALREAGFELSGPFADGNASAARLVQDEHELAALVHEESSAAAAEAVKAVVGTDTRLEIVPVETRVSS